MRRLSLIAIALVVVAGCTIDVHFSLLDVGKLKPASQTTTTQSGQTNYSEQWRQIR